jgi:hypothetical protein
MNKRYIELGKNLAEAQKEVDILRKEFQKKDTPFVTYKKHKFAIWFNSPTDTTIYDSSISQSQSWIIKRNGVYCVNSSLKKEAKYDSFEEAIVGALDLAVEIQKDKAISL